VRVRCKGKPKERTNESRLPALYFSSAEAKKEGRGGRVDGNCRQSLPFAPGSWLYLSARSQMLKLFLPLPVTLCASAHRTFRWHFQ